MSQDTLSPEQLYIVLRWDSAPALVAVGEGPDAHNQIEKFYPKARLIMSYPMLKHVLAVAQDAQVHEARPFVFKPTLHFCLTARRGKDSAALVVKATSLKKAMRKAKRLAYRGSDITLVGTREELEHYLTQLDDALEQGKQVPIELDLRGGGGVLVCDGMGRLPADVHDLLDVMIEPGVSLEGLPGKDIAEAIQATSQKEPEGQP